MKNRFKSLVVASLAVAMLGIAGCSSSGGTPSSGTKSSSAAGDEGDVSSLVKEAQKEGTVTWYSDQPPAIDTAAADAFKKEYGINVQFVSLNTAPLQQRYASEAASGAFGADVLSMALSLDFYKDSISKGWGETLTDAKLPVLQLGTYPKKYMHGDESAAIGFSPFYILYNKGASGSDALPKNLEDLTNPKYKGDVLLADPSDNDALVAFYQVVEQKYGDAWFKKVLANKPKFYPTVSGAGQAMMAGEGKYVTPAANAVAAALQQSGAPVGTVLPPVTTGSEYDIMLTAQAKSPHPAAARLFANWLLSKSGSKAGQGGVGISPYETSKLPSGFVTMPAVTADSRAQILKLLGITS